MNKFKKDDVVEVIVGRDKGKQGKIIKVFPTRSALVIEKVNLYKKTIKPSKESKGGIVDVPMPLNWSKVALVGPNNKKVKVRFEEKKGKKERIICSTGEIL